MADAPDVINVLVSRGESAVTDVRTVRRGDADYDEAVKWWRFVHGEDVGESLAVTLKGGPGSGWYSPPKGTHTGEKHRSVGSGKAKASVQTPKAKVSYRTELKAGDVQAYADKYGDIMPWVNPPKNEMDAFMHSKKPAEVYHVTMSEDDALLSIAQNGLVPGAQEAPGQDWKAEHSSYATYFHGHPIGAASNMEAAENNAVVVVGKIPKTVGMARRIVPDEDVSTYANDGLRTLRHREAVAVIAGLEPENIAGFVIPVEAGVSPSTVSELRNRGYMIWTHMSSTGPQGGGK